MKYQFASEEELIAFLRSQLIPATEAAEILEVSVRRVRQLEKDGKLPSVNEHPKMFLRSVVDEKKKELLKLRKKYRPYDE